MKLELKEGWWVQTELKCVEGWVSIQTEYWRSNGDGIDFTYNEKLGLASDDNQTDFEVGLKNQDWFLNEEAQGIVADADCRFDGQNIIKEIKSVDDLYVFGKALYEIDQLF